MIVVGDRARVNEEFTHWVDAEYVHEIAAVFNADAKLKHPCK
jgi:hypothetical protein